MWRAAVLRWIRPLRAARSSSLTAASLTSGEEPSPFAFLRAVRNAERCARLRTLAARDLRMFFFADAIFGTKMGLEDGAICGPGKLGHEGTDVKAPEHFDSGLAQYYLTPRMPKSDTR